MFTSSPKKIKPTVVIVVDGFGIAPESKSNAIYLANMKNVKYYAENYPSGRLIAAGESVGLPANEAGNSEVGHLTIGVGRVINQSLVRINKSIENGTFYSNEALQAAINFAIKNQSKLHIMGMISSGSVHSDYKHLLALVELCKRNKFGDVYIHLFTDGRDAPPQDAVNVIQEVESYLETEKVGKIVSVTGRYFAMDRDGRWDRTQKVYEAMVIGKGLRSESALQAVQEAYKRGETDEFIQPTIIPVKSHTASSVMTIDDNDSVIFFNFRIDRPRQLTMAFTLKDFENMKGVDFGYVPHELRGDVSNVSTFKREKIVNNLYFVTMTEYQKNLPVSAIAFPPPEITDSLPEVISKQGLKQMHIAESEKERMVMFYFDGLREQRLEGEDFKIIPSPNVSTYDKKPEMSAAEIAEEFRKRISKDEYSFFVINFANPDMVGHTGNLEATIKGLKAVDKAIGIMVDEVLKRDGAVLITADHGNAEQLLTYPTYSFFYTSEVGSVNTEHSNSPVPVYVISNQLKGRMVGSLEGSLQDVAPTVLKIMGIPVPEIMTGRDILTSVQAVSNMESNVVNS